MKWLKATILAAGVLLSLSTAPAQAQGVWDNCPGTASGATICGDKREATGIVKNLINLFLYVIGILAVIMIIHSGFKYINSRGDAEGVKSAKNTLLYAVTGLIVAVLAFTIVNFVIGVFINGSPTDTGGQPLQENQQVNENE